MRASALEPRGSPGTPRFRGGDLHLWLQARWEGGGDHTLGSNVLLWGNAFANYSRGSPRGVSNHILPVAGALASAGLRGPGGCEASRVLAFSRSVASGRRQLALRTHPSFSHLLPRHCPQPPSTFRTRDCLAGEPGGLQQVLGGSWFGRPSSGMRPSSSAPENC